MKITDQQIRETVQAQQEARRQAHAKLVHRMAAAQLRARGR